jgi:hypothetical protein
MGEKLVHQQNKALAKYLVINNNASEDKNLPVINENRLQGVNFDLELLGVK